MDKVKISMVMASLGALAIIAAAGIGCAVVTPDGSALTRNGRTWAAIGRATDLGGGTQPVNLPDATPIVKASPIFSQETP